MSTGATKPRRSPWSASFVQIILLLLILVTLAWRFWPHGLSLDPLAEPRPVTARGDLAEDEKATIELFRRASPSVVYITTLAVRRDAFTMDLRKIPEGTGSGFMWDAGKNGGIHIVTNYHVVQNADAAQVTLADHSTWKARSVGVAPDKDLAVLWIDAPKDRLHPILLGTSQNLQVGQKVFAIGNPFGLDQSLTTGIISALGREIESVTGSTIPDVIQTDAAINPGNSGGTLLDSAGLLIGVNTSIVSPSRASAGIGFAIPVDEVNRVVTELVRHGKLVRPGLGIHAAADSLTKQLGLKGVLVIDVLPDGPAAQAGLKPTRRDETGLHLGDVIQEIDGKPVRSVSEMSAVFDKYKVGDTVKVKVRRSEESEEIDVVLGSI